MKNIKSFKQLSEGKISYGLNQSQQDGARQFFTDYPGIKEWMQQFVKTSDTAKDYKKFLADKNALENQAQKDKAANDRLVEMGFEPEHLKSAAFGEKTFYKIKFPERVMFAELFQYIHDGGVNEAEENETPIYEELEESFMRILMKGIKINPSDVKSVDSFNKYMIVHMKHGDNIRIDLDIKHVQ